MRLRSLTRSGPALSLFALAVTLAGSAHAEPPPENAALARDGLPLAGYRGGKFFLRDRSDNFRLYPSGLLLLDADAWAGAGVSRLAGSRLQPQLFVRSARLGVAGQVLDDIGFSLVLAADGQPLVNSSGGSSEQRAAAPGQAPTAESARYASAQTPGNSAGILDAWLNYRAARELNLLVGQQQTPLTMQNTTPSSVLPMHELPLAVALGMPGSRDLGATLWGDVAPANLTYYVGVFEGDGRNRPGVDARGDVMARVTWKPLGSSEGELRDLRLGASGRFGSRDGARVNYDAPALRTQQGFAFWEPVYRDSLDRFVHVLPADAQRTLAFELWVPWRALDLQAELVLVNNQTREAVEGFQATNTERIGRQRGAAGYLELGYTIIGRPRLTGEPGRGTRPSSVELAKPAPLLPEQSVDVVARVEALQVSYSGDARGGDAEPEGGLDGKVEVWSYGLGANYWATRHARLSFNYVAYDFPGVKSGENRAITPGELAVPPAEGARWLHELGVRFGVMF